jgi:hypothetical protein
VVGKDVRIFADAVPEMTWCESVRAKERERERERERGYAKMCGKE